MNNKVEKELLSALSRDKTAIKERLKSLSFFQEHCHRGKAEQCLKDKKDGSYLVRSNHVDSKGFVLSVFLRGKISHLKIINCGSLEYTIDGHCVQKTSTGLDGLIQKLCEDPGDLLSAKLKKPVKGCVLPPPLALHTGFNNILHRAIEKGGEKHERKSERIISLLRNGHALCPDINMRNESGFTVLHQATLKNQASIVKAILEVTGVEASPIDFHGKTPLHHACEKGFSEMVQILVENGANVMHRCFETGEYPIHEAARSGSLTCIQKLLDKGACAWPRSKNVLTPYELAKDNKWSDCAEYLDSYEPPKPPTKKEDWYHGKISRQDVEKLFDSKGMNDGLFLVRDSSSKNNCFVLTFSYQEQLKIYEIRDKKTFYFIGQGPLFYTLEDLIYYYSLHADGIDCTLLQSISPKGSLIRVKSFISQSDEDLYLSNYATAKVLRNGITEYEVVDGNTKNPIYYRQNMDSQTGTLERKFHGHIIEKKELRLEYELGQGEFGSVMRGEWCHDGIKTPVAVKTLRDEFVDSGRQSFLGEAEVMVKLDHRCIVRLLGVCEGPPLMIVQELIALGSLLDYLLDYPEKINVPKDLSHWAAQIACGMLYFEDQHFVHRDLAARNILLASKMQAKVGDFGLSRTVGANSDVYQASKGGRWPIRWYAPESVNYGNFSHASDVWSFGVTLWEMFTLGDQPYGEMSGNEVVQHVDRGGRLEKPDQCPQNVYEMMLKCWERNSTDRCTFYNLWNFFNEEGQKLGRRESSDDM